LHLATRIVEPQETRPGKTGGRPGLWPGVGRGVEDSRTRAPTGQEAGGWARRCAAGGARVFRPGGRRRPALRRGRGRRIIQGARTGDPMSAVIEAPVELVEAIADMRFPAKADARLRWLMDQNTNGRLTPAE